MSWWWALALPAIPVCIGAGRWVMWEEGDPPFGPRDWVLAFFAGLGVIITMPIVLVVMAVRGWRS